MKLVKAPFRFESGTESCRSNKVAWFLYVLQGRNYDCCGMRKESGKVSFW
jgi:hypothetical protein